MLGDSDDSYLAAVEQYIYWREQGLLHHEMLAAVGVAPHRHLTAELVIRYLARAHHQLSYRLVA